MLKKISKIITIGIFLFLVFGLFSITNIKTIQAEKFVPNVPIPGATDIELSKSTKPIAEYMRTLYTWGIGVVGVLAGVVLVIAGIIWLTAGGNNTQVDMAKKWIAGSLSGLVLALGSYFLLHQINPDLVSFKYYTIPGVDVGSVNKSEYSTCYWKNTIDTSEGSKEVKQDAAYCPDTQKDHPDLFCVCQKKEETKAPTETHKACCRRADLAGAWHVECGTFSGSGPDICTEASTCTLSASLPICTN